MEFLKLKSWKLSKRGMFFIKSCAQISWRVYAFITKNTEAPGFTKESVENTDLHKLVLKK